MSKSIFSPPVMRWAFWTGSAVVSYLLLSPQVAQVPLPFSWVSAAAHMGVHAGLAFVALHAFTRRELALLIGLGLYAVGTESLQHVIPGRFFDLADMSLNLFGVVIGNGVAHLARCILKLD
ncbi:MAG: VanZ family protein [Alphaproteobacteria bacterium]